MIDSARNGAANGSISGRAHVPGLASAHPMGAYLPGLYQDDDLAQRWTAALDLVLAPIFSSLDNFEAYLDPQLAPLDFVHWLGAWVGLIADETWPVERRRAFVSQASALYRMRGTPRGLAAHVEIFSGGEVEIVEKGGVAWSTTTDAGLPGSTGFDLLVRVRVDDAESVDAIRLDALVAAAKPAHLTHRVEVVTKAAKPAPTRRASGQASAEAQPEAPPSQPPEGDGTPHEEDGAAPEEPS